MTIIKSNIVWVLKSGVNFISVYKIWAYPVIIIGSNILIPIMLTFYKYTIHVNFLKFDKYTHTFNIHLYNKHTFGYLQTQ